MNDNLLRAVDAFSASPAIRLRYQMLAAKMEGIPFPPSIDDRANHDPLFGEIDFAARARAEGHPLAELIRMRQEAADEVERLLAFLDESEGIVGEDAFDDDEDAAVDDAGCDEDFDAEPILGFTENHPTPDDEDEEWWFAYRSDSDEGRQDLEQGTADDREGDEHDGCEPSEDEEYSLCGIHAGDVPSHEDCELDDADDEPSLGYTSVEVMGSACAGTTARCFDLEEDAGDMPECDPAECGIADMGGLMEQIGRSGDFRYQEVL